MFVCHRREWTFNVSVHAGLSMKAILINQKATINSKQALFFYFYTSRKKLQLPTKTVNYATRCMLNRRCNGSPHSLQRSYRLHRRRHHVFTVQSVRVSTFNIMVRVTYDETENYTSQFTDWNIIIRRGSDVDRTSLLSWRTVQECSHCGLYGWHHQACRLTIIQTWVAGMGKGEALQQAIILIVVTTNHT